MEFYHNDDGANYQAQAVLAYLRGGANIEESWNKEICQYAAKPSIARWHNCREQGYVVSLRSENYSKQINVAFFEHRNSDSICAIAWEQITTSGNPPTIESMETGGEVYKDKWDVSHTEGFGRAQEMAEWIYGELHSFWLKNKRAA